jgi:hypothetical protein
VSEIAVARNRLLFGPESDDELITVDPFPWVKVTRNDFEQHFRDPEPKGLGFEFVMNVRMADMNSYGVIFNSFHELEPLFVDYWNRECTPKAWSMWGPFAWLSRQSESQESRVKPRKSELELLEGFEERVKDIGCNGWIRNLSLGTQISVLSPNEKNRNLCSKAHWAKLCTTLSRFLEMSNSTERR